MTITDCCRIIAHVGSWELILHKNSCYIHGINHTRICPGLRGYEVCAKVAINSNNYT